MDNNIIILGIVISLLFYELTGISPSGLIVAGYFALNFHSPYRIAYTFGVVLLTWGIAKLLSKVMILYGRRRFAVMILLSFAINVLVIRSGVLVHTPGIIGKIVPGIIALEWERQGVLKSTLSLGIVVVLNLLVIMWLGVPVISL
ncbi:poly-gamma-glutamate biosynthesis protein PgsC [Fusibacter ferrireducens]|uniref:Poly-gamma-glutamate biosynthesis protein PgsC n=1 Tax=Fusibacter ferrireducens TaxID=2785058 RepID=A0ABR9ZYV1_9FIRM|nr:poly-gamma-glutamate biosynthesis protein PgsC [Fusibacter ferrireducens]MBF4695636.1 poly-gamma-glutamate biosynthesis protein PgsC [Fusibacter ferrireducens]